MNIRFLYLFIFIFTFSSLLGNKKKPYTFNNKPANAKTISKKYNYCDLKKNLNVAIVKVNEKASYTLTGKAANRKKYSFMDHYAIEYGDTVSFEVGKHYKKNGKINLYAKGLSEHKRIFVATGDARHATQECGLSEVVTGGLVSNNQLKCITKVINEKSKKYIIISDPANTGWQRKSIQRLVDVEKYNENAKKNGEELIVYKTLRYPETRKLIEDIVYVAIENALANSDQFTVADRSNIEEAYEEIKNSQKGLISEKDQKNIGKMVGADLIAIANITSYTENRIGDKTSKVTMSAEVKLLNVESGVIFNSFTIEKDHSIASKKKYVDSRREMLQKWSKELTERLDDSLKDFPFQTEVKLSRRGSLTMGAGMNDGVSNGMFFSLSLIDCYEDDDGEEICEEEDIGLIQVTDNNRGRDSQAGSKSKCEPLDFNEKLEQYNPDDIPYIYIARTPSDIADELNCR